MPIFMKVGPVAAGSEKWTHGIRGDVAIPGYEDWVAIDSFRYDIKHSEEETRKRSEADSDEESDAPKVEPFHVTKSTTDSSGPDFMRWMMDGDEMKVQIDVCSESSPGHARGVATPSTKKTLRCHARYVLEHVTLTSYSVDMESSGSKASVTVAMTLDYETLRVDYFSYDRANQNLAHTNAVVHKQQADGSEE